MRFFQTIRGRLFLCYSSIITLVIVAFAVSFYSYTANILEKRASESLQQLAININQYLDAAFKNSNDTANRVISSDPIKDIFYMDNGTEAQQIQNKWYLFQMLFTVTGSSTANQINMVGEDGSLALFGKQFDLTNHSGLQPGELPWFQECLAREGRVYITEPHIPQWGPDSRPVISVCRAFNEMFGSRYNSIVEVQEDYSSFAQLIETAISLPDNRSNAGVIAYAYNETGKLVYPYPAPEEPLPDYYSLMTANSGVYGTFPVEATDGRNILAFSRSDYSGWWVAVCQDEQQLLAPVSTFRNNIVLLGLLVLLFTNGITYIIARQLTEPIRKIQKSISKLDLADLSLGQERPLGSATYELTKLNQSYQQMVERLEQSLEETVTARSHEIRSRMLALQAQMNPHFLYNTITIISIKAEQQNDTQVVEMCRCLSGMLRYVAQETPAAVPLSVELAYLDQHLYLMNCRYPGQFRVQIEIPEELRQVELPKLLLQPLVENCFKHGFNIRPPWEIKVEGRREGNRWQISVVDNGVGFPPERLTVLNQTSANPDINASNSLGLLNIRSRLQLQYKENAVFLVENLPEGGSRVTIGGIV